MEEILIVKDLDASDINNIKGKIKIEDQYFKQINEIVCGYWEKYGKAPEIELNYNFIYNEETQK